MASTMKMYAIIAALCADRSYAGTLVDHRKRAPKAE